MFTIFDRYVAREMLMPSLLFLVVLTFLLVIPPILRQGGALETFVAQGVAWSIVINAILLLLPSALSLTIPMAVLMGILVAFGRLSADREFVAMQACGVSVYRLLRPVAVIAATGTIATLYVIVVLLPSANQTFREITFSVVASRVENTIKPQVFFNYFPNQVLYVRDLPAGGGMRDVLLADSSVPDEITVYFAREGRILVDRAKRTVQLQLVDGTHHKTMASRPDAYEGAEFESVVLTMDPQTVFPPPPSKGVPEMTVAELRRNIAQAAERGDPGYSARFMIQQKFSFPIACLVLGLIGLPLGVSNRKDGKLASFVVGFAVIFIYYILFYMARAAAIGGILNSELAPWIPNILLAILGAGLLFWRARASDRPILLTMPTWRVRPDPQDSAQAARSRRSRTRFGRVIFVLRVPHLNLPRPRILDVYTSGQYVRVFVLALVGALGVFYISTFIDLADKLFRGSATTALLLRYFYYQTPQYVFFVIPIAGLIATLVTVGVMTKNSEIVVMKACGVSLYRAVLPLLLFGVATSLLLYALQEQVLVAANREADRLNGIIRQYPSQTFDGFNRRWVAGEAGDIYHYDFFDAQLSRFTKFTLYDLNDRQWHLDTLTYADAVTLTGDPGAGGRKQVAWQATGGWVRTLTTAKQPRGAKPFEAYTPFAAREVSLEPPTYFKTDTPDAGKMTYGQLERYIAQLKASGANATPQTVQLRRKIAFPFVTIIMTLLAVPFAVMSGRRGALYGVGIGIVISIAYWVAQSVFGALGEGGAITPMLAAWAPNLLFGAAALYMTLTVRT